MISERAIVRPGFGRGQRVALLVPGRVGRAARTPARRRPLPDHAARQPEVPAIDAEVLDDDQLDVEGVFLRHHVRAGPIAERSRTGWRRGWSVPAGRRQTQPIIRIVEDYPRHRPEEVECLAPVQVEIDPVHRREIAEPLGQAARTDEHLLWDTHSRYRGV